LKQPAFIVAFIVLMVAAVSLNAATRFMKLHFKKESVALAHPLDDIHMKLPPTFPAWVCVSKDQLGEEVEQELGTRQYVFRYYVRHSALKPDELAHFEGLDNPKRMEYLTQLRSKRDLQNDIINFAVTYYTGKADTVAHIPERCYTADGYEPTELGNDVWNVKTPQLKDGRLPVRYITFDDSNISEGRVGSQQKKNVAYFFHTNGIYTSESRDVRLKLQNLLARYGYYAKVELLVQSKDREAAKEAMQDFLRSALPEVENCLPDWAAVERMAAGNR
jgi:hypothetical protein